MHSCSGWLKPTLLTGTRESAHPIHRYSGVCCAHSLSK